MKYNHKKVIIWDTSNSIPDKECMIILWNSHSDKKHKNVISILDLIDVESVLFRKQYLNFIWGIGETKIDNESLIDKLKIRKNFSYWWLTLITEKSIYKSPHINDIIKLFAFEKFINNSEIEVIEISTRNKNLAYVLKDYAASKSIQFFCKTNSHINFLSLFNFSFYFLQFIYSLISSIISNILYYNETKRIVGLENNQITLFDYFINFNQSNQKTYDSDYWRKLNILLKNKDYKINYFHIVIDKGFRSKKNSIKKNKELNNIINENHYLINVAFSSKIIFRACKDYFLLLYKSYKISKINLLFEPSFSELNLWSFFKVDWYKSTIGSVAFKNLLFFNYFEDLFKNMPFQKAGIFLFESQSWEIALTNAWKNANQGRLIANAHSTIRFWDLRYYQHGNYFTNDQNRYLLKPDFYAFNGPVSYNIAYNNFYPQDLIYKVEALRYIKSNNNSIFNPLVSKISILICGDYNEIETRQLLEMIESVYCKLPNNYEFTFKPHPASSISFVTKFPMKSTSQRLVDLLYLYDIVLTTNSTSAVIDAYMMKVCVLQLINYTTLNFSPLYNIDNNIFFSNPADLYDKLINFKNGKKDIDFFYLESHIPRWNALINNL